MYDYDYLKRVDQKRVSENNNFYEIPNIYAEIPNVYYETLQPYQSTTELPIPAPPQSSASNTRPALPGELQQQPCCKKSARFWCLLAAVMSTITVILLASLVTGINSYQLKYKVIIYKLCLSKVLL